MASAWLIERRVPSYWMFFFEIREMRLPKKEAGVRDGAGKAMAMHDLRYLNQSR